MQVRQTRQTRHVRLGDAGLASAGIVGAVAMRECALDQWVPSAAMALRDRGTAVAGTPLPRNGAGDSIVCSMRPVSLILKR